MIILKCSSEGPEEIMLTVENMFVAAAWSRLVKMLSVVSNPPDNMNNVNICSDQYTLQIH